jgi:hypothetical protein
MANPTTNPNSVGAPVGSQLEEMRKPFIISAAFHLALLLIALFGLHLLPHKPIEMATPISVSMLKPSDLARSNHIDEPHEEKEKPPEPEVSKAPEPPKESSASTPPPPPPTPTPPVEQKVETPPPPPPAPAPPEKPMPQLTPTPQPQTAFQPPAQLPQLQKPMQVAKPLPPKPDPKKVKQLDQDFQSLLTNLTPAVPKADQVSKDTVKSTPQAAARAQASDQMTADEMARVRQQLAGCWVIPAGALSADKLSIEVQTEYNSDRTLRTAQLVDTARYNTDPFFRAAADSVMRALHNPACNPLELPAGKFDEWHLMTLTFNPKDMLGL